MSRHDYKALKEQEVIAREFRSDNILSMDFGKYCKQIEELEKDLSKIEILSKIFIKEPIFEDMKKIFGKNVEILINY